MIKTIKKLFRSKKFYYKLWLFLFFFSQFGIIFLTFPKKVDTAALTVASATLSNSRLSYRAGVASGSSGASTVNIDSSGFSDNNTNHLFPKDVLCFADSNFAGCSEQKTYTVNSIVDSDTMQLTTNLTADLGANDLAIATQSGTLTLSFVTATEIPVDGDILVTIPMANGLTGGLGSDGFPDTGASLAASGSDINNMEAGDNVAITGCTDENWDQTPTWTEGNDTSDHTIMSLRSTSSCAASTTITVTIGPGLVNPAPITSGHAQGTADIYTINIKTRDGSDNTLDQIDVNVAPIEAVFVSATVNETMSFVVAGVNATGSTCGQTTDVTTTVYSVPWGTIATADTFYEASQQLTVSTNSDGGYAVTIEENDQMGKDGIACTGAAAGEANNCIKDTVCDIGPCSESSTQSWITATNNGMGYSLEDQSGSDAVFEYNDTGTFDSRQLADQEVPETKANIMYNAGAVSGSSVYVCYRLSISDTQPAGYYFNKVKYTATPVF